MTILIGTEKSSHKIHYLVMIKILNKLRIEAYFLSLMKSLQLPSLRERLQCLSAKIGTRQGCPHLPTVLNIVLEALDM